MHQRRAKVRYRASSEVSSWPARLLRSRARRMACGLILALGMSRTVLAASWQAIGPEGGGVDALAADPVDSDLLYAGFCADAPYRSQNGGQSWKRLQPFPAASSCLLAVDSSGALYAATVDQGILRSLDHGDSWVAANGAQPLQNLNLLVADPVAPGVLYATAAFGLVPPRTLLMSLDAGDSWTPIGRGLPTGLEVKSLAVAADRRGTLYVALPGRGVYKSRDRGAHWRSANAGLPRRDVSAVAVDANDPLTVYAGSGGGFFVSRDGGATWRLRSRGLSSQGITAVVARRGQTGAVYAATADSGLFASTDRGSHWRAIGAGLPLGAVAGSPELGRVALRALVSDAAATGALYAAVEGIYGGPGIFKSLTNGSDWIASAGGIVHTEVSTLLASASAVYAGVVGTGLERLRSGAESWQALDAGMGNRVVRALASDPGHSATIFAGTSHYGVYRSEDGGQTWTPTAGPPGGPADCGALQVDASGRVLTGTFWSTDAGVSWHASNLSGLDMLSLALAPSAPGVVYATGCQPGPNGACLVTFASSADGGETWIQPGSVDSLAPAPVVVDPRDARRVYTSFDARVQVSTDGGVTWSPSSLGPAAALLIDPNDPSILYAAVDQQVSASPDGGATWAPLGPPLPAPVTQLAAPAGSPGTVYAGTLHAGVFLLTGASSAGVATP